MPTILQQETVECGAACLAMVLAHYGRWVSLEILRDLCGVSRDGTKASNVLKAARAQGLVAKGLRKEVDELAKLPFPQIVFWNFNHFVVVEGMDRRGRVWLNDPASGPRRITRAEFDQGFTGVVLAFEPDEGLVRTAGRGSLAALIRRSVAGHWRGLSLAVLAGTLMIFPGIVTASFSRLFVDGVLVEGRLSWLAILLLAMVATAMLKGVLYYMQQSLLVRSQVAMATGMAARQMWAVLGLPLGFFAQRFPGDIANRFGMVDRFASLLTTGLAPALIGAIAILGYGAALLLLDPVLGLVAAGTATLSLAMLIAASRGLEDAARRMVADESRLHAATIQGMSMIEDFRISGTEAAFVGRWAGYQARVLDAEQRSSLRINNLGEASALAIALGGMAVLVVGGLRVMDGAITIGILIAFQTLMGSFFAPLGALVGFGAQLQQLRSIGERLDDIARYRAGTDSKPADAAAAPLPVQLDLVLSDVAFGYAPLDPPFIKDFSLSIPAGARIALVGGSGSGKSTLGRLIVSLSLPSAGVITLGGVPLNQWPVPELRRRVAYVDQTVSLFEGNVRDNLTLWDDTLPEDRMVGAAREAGAHDFITARPGGYAAALTEGAGNLSGGERQRLAIARALAIGPSILVLDEATSALDPIVEQRVMDAVRRRGCTCIIIAHRLSTIRDCDSIIVLRKGRIAEIGTHNELLAVDGEYRRLVEH